MFLIDRLVGSPGLRADLAPQPLFGGAGDLVRAALVARPPALALVTSPPAPSPTAPSARRPASQLDLALPAPPRRRRAG